MTAPQPITMRTIAHAVCIETKITLDELIGQSRKKRVSRPRHEFMWRCRQVHTADGAHRYSTTLIGMFLGGRDHTTVVHGVRRYAERKGLR